MKLKEWFSITSPAQEAAAVRAELARLREEREAVIEQSTARRLERIDKKIRELTLQQSEIDRARSRLAGDPTADERELTEQIKENIHRERQTMAEARFGIPQRFIRTDAVAHFGRQVEEARTRLEKIERRLASLQPNVRPSGRVIDERNDLQAVVDEWERSRPLAELGEKIAAIREERRHLEQRREALRDERIAAVA